MHPFEGGGDEDIGDRHGHQDANNVDAAFLHWAGLHGHAPEHTQHANIYCNIKKNVLHNFITTLQLCDAFHVHNREVEISTCTCT